jgi:two-component system response regulator YesN
LIKSLNQLPVIQGRQIQRAGEFLFDLLYEIAQIDTRTIRQRLQPVLDQGESLSEAIDFSPGWQGPSTTQVQLAARIRIGDRLSARKILDAVAGKILMQHGEGLGKLKARFLELLGFLSRSAAECGADGETILEKHALYIDQLRAIDSKQKLCQWIGHVFDEFINITYNCQDVKRLVQVRPAINFMDANFDKEISVADIARACHLSPSRLAHVFKEYMNVTIVDYLNSIRLEKAKHLLLTTDMSCTEICYIVGFNNQSYFIRAFKSYLGTTPAKYRAENKTDSKPSVDAC